MIVFSFFGLLIDPFRLQQSFQTASKALQLRLEQIPQEMERETEVIRQRFANPTPRLFPLAITFLVPPKIF